MANFQSQSWIQSNLGWDFTNVWQMSATGSETQGLPILKWQQQQVQNYSITASAGTGGTISPSGSVSVSSGASKTFTFTPNTGYEINQVLVDGTANSSAKTNGWYTFPNVTANHTISVSFAAKQYTLYYDAQGGSVSPTSKTVTYGSQVGTLPTPTRNGYTFGGWFTGTDGSGTQYFESTVYNTVGNLTLCAKWTPITYSIYTSAGTGGTISPSGTVTVDYGDNQTFTFTPNTGYEINQVLIDGVANSSAKANGYYTFSNITANHTISVSFEKSCIPNLVVQVWGNVLSVINNSAYNGGYKFTAYQWLKNGVAISGETQGNLRIANNIDYSADYSCRLTTSGGQIITTCPIKFRTVTAFAVYPNPVQNTITIEDGNLLAGDVINVYSTVGTLVLQQRSTTDVAATLDLSSLAKGVYFVEVNGRQARVIKN
jgi:uncharacterized repeat protein (TIGR02543 family)